MSEVAQTLMAARSTVYRWARWYFDGGIEALKRSGGGRRASTVTDELLEALEALLEEGPRRLGYLRTRWSSEPLSVVLDERHGVRLHPSTVRRALRGMGFRWRRARATLCKRDPRKAEKLQAIQRALEPSDTYSEVFFLDEADIDLNPRIGFTWSRRGEQDASVTPGKNRKHYVAGAMHAHSGRLVWVEHERTNTILFLKLLVTLQRHYRRTRRIALILDNYIVHKTDTVARWLARSPKRELLCQPVYYPWINRNERLRKAMHDTVTRNHRCTTLYELCRNVKRFFDVVQLFPGAGHGVAGLGSAI